MCKLGNGLKICDCEFYFFYSSPIFGCYIGQSNTYMYKVVHVYENDNYKKDLLLL